jgi:uncharacterized protein (DUF427 family)
MSRPLYRIDPAPGEESVWDYPRPPRVERCTKRITVAFGGRIIADTTRALRVLETSQPPVYYLPPEDVRLDVLVPGTRTTFCEFKGTARYFGVVAGGRSVPDAAWSYPRPAPGYEAIRDHVAFHAGKVDACAVDGERVRPQPGDFYGGWITRDVRGPFKGDPGTEAW